jgi:glycerophosphoryl diester phosphodiesterase
VLIISDRKQVLVSGHRGDCRTTPEQTMAAFAEAVRAGADAIEFDVQWTKDQQMVLMHDWTIDRTTSGTGLVSEMTYDEIRACDAGSWFSEQFQGAQVPSFDEVIAFAMQHPRLLINAEVKNPGLTIPQARALRDAVSAADVADRTIVSSFDPSALVTFRSVSPEWEIASAVVSFGEPHQLEAISASNSTYYMPRWWSLTPELVQELQGTGIGVWVWPAITDQDFEAAFALEPDAIVVDSVADFRRWYAARQQSRQGVHDGGDH